MSFLIRHTVRASFANPLNTSYKFSKHYSVLCSYKTENFSDNLLNRKTPINNQNVQCRNFSVQGFVEGYLNFFVNIGNSAPAIFFTEQLVNVHDCGVPWWATILVSCASLRTFLIFPMVAAQDKEFTEMIQANRKMEKNHKLMEQEVFLLAKKNKWTQEQTIQEIKKRQKISGKSARPTRNLQLYRVVVAVFAQISLWTIFTICIRKLCIFAEFDTSLQGEILKQEFSNEGLLWFKNLLNTDRYGIPVLLAIGSFAGSELLELKRGTKSGLLTYIVRGAIILISVASATLPAAVSLMWAVSAWTALGQYLLLLSPRFRKLVRLPPNPLDANHPYKVLRQRLLIKWGI